MPLYGFPYDTKIDVPPAPSNDLTTVAAVVAALGPHVIVTPADEAWIATQIPIASGIITGYCKRPFIKATVCDYYRLADTGRRPFIGLYVSRWPIGQVTIKVGTTVLDAADFRVTNKPESGKILRIAPGAPAPAPTTWETECEIEVHHTSGYEMPATLPPEVGGACTEIVKAMYFGRGRDPAMRSLDMPDVGGVTFSAGVASAGGAGNSSDGGQYSALLAPLEPYRNWGPTT